MIKQWMVNFLLGMLLFSSYAASYDALLSRRTIDAGVESRFSSGMWSFPDIILHIVSGEFKGLMADYLTLEAGARVGTKIVRTSEGKLRQVENKVDWSAIYRILTASQSLDPAFQQTYLVAQGWLPWEAGMVDETQKILQTAAENRPWDWQPTHFKGFNSYYFLNDPGEAGKLFLEAAKKPDAPPFLSILGARLAQKGGETRAAIALMQSMLVDKQETDPGYSDMLDRLHALEGVLAIEQAKVSYEKKYGNRPQSLKDLTASGILPSIPDNPYDVVYCMDKQGKIYFDNPNCLGENQ